MILDHPTIGNQVLYFSEMSGNVTNMTILDHLITRIFYSPGKYKKKFKNIKFVCKMILICKSSEWFGSIVWILKFQDLNVKHKASYAL